MNLSRRQTLAMGGAVATVTLLPLSFAHATPESAMAQTSAFTGGADAGEGNITLTAPEIAENGNTVPISVSAPGAVSILIVAEGNPNPDVATFHFGEMAESSASTRIRLAGTQNIVAVAQMADGSFIKTAASVKVTIGGCGG
jgi:sulfur-oxidizing protein SoxY